MQIGFIHSGSPEMASYRYRARIPCEAIGPMYASMNNLVVDVAIFCKPEKFERALIERARGFGAAIVVDFCDDHFASFEHYHEFAKDADAITCPTAGMQRRLKALGYDSTVIADPFEFEEAAPHFTEAAKVLWFGHSTNFGSLQRVLHKILLPMRMVSNMPMAMPWSIETMYDEFSRADIVILPATKDYKSPNRAVESVRQGCFVVAEPHPSLEGFPGIWIGDIPEGIEWARQNPQLANERTRQAQQWVGRFSPRTLGNAWKNLCNQVKSHCTSVAVGATGTDG